MSSYYTLTCQQCNGQFVKASTNRLAKYCSKQCFAIGVDRKVDLICGQCGSGFRRSPSGANQVCCSQRCAGLIKRKLNAEYFWSNVDKTGGQHACWPYARVNKMGYGRISTEHFGQILAHRFSIELATGRVLGKKDIVCHKCDNPPCVNPSHLFVGTSSDNSKDAASKGRMAHGERQHLAKLSDIKVTAILEALRQNKTKQSLADNYGVTWNAIYYIAKGRTWKHIPR